MASSKISELVDGGSFLPGDDTIIVRNGANFKVDPTINAVNAWVNFNGTGTVAIRASYNVSSITDNGTGNYTVNFTNALTDANYCVSSTSTKFATGTNGRRQADCVNPRERTASNFVVIITASSDGTDQDAEIIDLQIVR